MRGKGRPFKPGQSGNPGGRPKRDPEVRALCEKFTPDAIETLAEIMPDKDSQPSARVSAAMAILKKTLPDLSAVEHTGDTIQPSRVPSGEASGLISQFQKGPIQAAVTSLSAKILARLATN